MWFGDSRRTRGSRRGAGRVRELGRGPRQPGKLPQRSCGPRNGPCYGAQSTHSTNIPKVTGWLWGDEVVQRPGPPVFTCTTDAEWPAQTTKQKIALREPCPPSNSSRISIKILVPETSRVGPLASTCPPFALRYTVFSCDHPRKVEAAQLDIPRVIVMIPRLAISG